MKVSDYVAHFLAERGARDVFLVSGGGIMHLLDSVGRHPDLRYQTAMHEQAAVVAAEGYARTCGKIGVAMVTVGPGAANAVAGLPGAWVDSVPLIVLAGQVRQDIIADYRTHRQYGPQEANTLDMARPVTKFAVSVRDPQKIREALELAFHHALTGRPGPVWIEFPLDVQGANVDEALMLPANLPVEQSDPAQLTRDVRDVIERLQTADRPIIVGGNGVRLAGATDVLHAVLEKTGIPIVMPITAKDLVAEDDPRFVGIFGTAGQRRANFAVQNSTLLLAIGAGLNIQKVGFNFAGFAPKATKVLVDVDPVQLRQQALKPDVAIQADARAFLEEMLRQLESVTIEPAARWTNACAEWKRKYPIITPDYATDPTHVNSYLFMDALSNAVRANDTIVPGAGLDTVSCYQAFRPKRGQRVLISGWGSMGWDLPLAIGACVGSGRHRTISVTGDGSIQWNIQELITIAQYQLPIKIFLFNNKGFGSIRATQNSFFAGHFVGADSGSGVKNPNFAKLAEAYGLRYARIESGADLEAGITAALADDLPLICEVNIANEQTISPKASAFRRVDGTFESRPLEDMSPFLSREEVHANMHLFDEEPATT